MDESLHEYKKFIDGLVRLQNSVEARRAQEGVWIKHEAPSTEQSRYNFVLASLSSEQREVVSELLKQTRLSGIHDTLVFITDNQYQLTTNNIALATEPFGTEMYYDFISRCNSDLWPDERTPKN